MSKTAAPTQPSSNWKALRQALRPSTASSPSSTTSTLKRKRSHSDFPAASAAPPPSRPKISLKGKERQVSPSESEAPAAAVAGGKKKGFLPIESILEGGKEGWQADTGQYLAIDCEMVGVGPEGSESTLARVSIVNYHGVTILDRFVRPREKVTDYRTWVSGVREEDLRNAPSFTEVQKEVAALIKERILIGHAISNDTNVLLLSHPRHLTRDTAKYGPLQGLARTKLPGLKTLSKLVLGVEIQTGEHSSIDDARATMAIYRSQRSAWEDALRTHAKPTLLTHTTPALASLDLSTISTTGVKKSTKPKTLGLAATIRHARHEAEVEAGVWKELDEEEAGELERRKRKLEEDEGVVMGFDFERKKEVKVVEVVKVVKEKKKDDEGKKKVRKVVGRAFKGDREKRPKSKEGWWDES